MLHYFVFVLIIFLVKPKIVDSNNEYYYMACVCSQYNACSDWLIVTELKGIILP